MAKPDSTPREAAVTLASYVVRVRPKYKTGQHELLGALGTPQDVLLKTFEATLKTLAGAHDLNEDQRRLFRVLDLHRSGDVLAGRVESGHYGYAADGINVRTRKQSFRRTPDDAELLPFYFRLCLPPARNMGLLLLQRFGISGVFGEFVGVLQRAFEPRFPDRVLELERLVPAEVVRELMEGKLLEVHLTSYSKPSDITDKFRFGGNLESVGTVTISARAKRHAFLPDPEWLRKLRKRKTTVVTIPDLLGGDATRAKIRVSYAGRARMVDLNKPDHLAPYIDVTGEVKMDPNGHPNYDSIDAYAEKLQGDLLKELGRA